MENKYLNSFDDNKKEKYNNNNIKMYNEKQGRLSNENNRFGLGYDSNSCSTNNISNISNGNQNNVFLFFRFN